MAAIVFAIGVVIAQRATLVAFRNDIASNALAQTLIEHKVFANKFAIQTLSLNLPGIFDNTAFELKNVFKTFVLEIGAGFFATNAASAIHQNIFIGFEIL